MNKWMKIFCFFVFFIAIDALSKYYTTLCIPKMSLLHPFYPYGGIAVFKDFFRINLSLNYVENLGAAWGILAKYSKYLLILRIFVVVGIFLFLIFSKLAFKKAFPYVLICSGAIGNILDYIFYGHVVDMIYFTFGSYSYPVFNLADSFIVIGIATLLLTSFINKEKLHVCRDNSNR
jgi:signal peptidase II